MLHPSFSSLRIRLLVLIVLTVAPMLGLTLYTNLELRRMASDQVKADALRLVRIAADDQSDAIKDTRQLLFALAQLPEVQGTDPAICSEFLARLSGQYPQYALLGVAGQNGDLWCSAPVAKEPINLASRAGFRQALQSGDFAVGEYQVDPLSGRATLDLGQPILSQADKVRAVVLASLDLKWLNNLAAKAQLPEGSTLTVFDRNSTVLVRYPDSLSWIGQRVPEVPMVETVLARGGQGTTEARGIDGVSRLFAFLPLHVMPAGERVYVSVGIPTSIAYRNAHRLLVRDLLGLGMVAALVLAAAWFGGDLFLVRRVKLLVDAAERLGVGDLGARTGLPHREGELGRLARAFDEMAGSLERSRAQRDRTEEALRSQIAFGQIIATVSTRFINLPLDEIDSQIADALGIVGRFAGVRRVYAFLLSEGGDLADRAYEWCAEGVEPIVERLRTLPVIAFAWMARTLSQGEILHVPRVADLPPEASSDREALQMVGLRSFVCVPLAQDSAAVGFLGFDLGGSGDTWPQHITLLQILGEIVLNALQRKRAERDLQVVYRTLERQVAERTRELSVLYQVTAVASSSLDLQTVLESSLDCVLAAMDSTVGVFHLLDDEGQTLHLAVSRGVPPDLVTDIRQVPMEGNLASQLIERGQPLVLSDVVDGLRPLLTVAAAGVRAYIGVPLYARGRPLGVLSVVGGTGRQFDPEEVSLLVSIGNQVGVAAENARLYRQAEQLAVMRERQRLARELHDSVTQALYSQLLLSEAGRRLARSGELPQVEEVLGRLGDIGQQALKEMRLLVYELRSFNLQERGLAYALEQRLEAVERRAGVKASLTVEGPLALPGSVQEALYRVVQEALNNALKHAAASSVAVRIRTNGKCVEVEVVDDGRGFDPDSATNRGGLGLVSMRERMEKLGGTLEILSAPGKGTAVKAALDGRDPDQQSVAPELFQLT